MFCPLCKAEYREAFTICASCNVALVPVKPPDENPDDVERPNVAIWRGESDMRFANSLIALVNAGIPAEQIELGDGQSEIRVFPGTQSAAQEVLAMKEFRAARELQICPLCLSEYGPEKRLCPLCLADLTELGVEPEVARIWSGDHPGDARLIRIALRCRGIPFSMLDANPHVAQILLPRAPMGAARYAFEVLPEDRDAALNAIKELQLVNESLLELLPNEDAAGDDPFEEGDDLCAEAWRGSELETAEGLRIIFREHEIESRLEETSGEYRVFVTELDRERAAALACDVVSGVVPPELDDAMLQEEGSEQTED